jgi:hypothetical protein
VSSPAPSPSSPVTTLPFDPTGTALSNKIVGERQVLTAVTGYADYSVLIPLAAPYFQESLSMTLYPQGTPLVEGVDYVPTHYFIEATRSIGQPIYGSVTFYNNSLQGVISFNYQSLGGSWTLTEPQIAQILANITANPRITTWEQITDLPNTFPPINHVWDIDDMVNMDSVVAAINDIVGAIGTAQTSAINAHIANMNNPHQTTATQVGLGLVQNFGMAQPSDASGGTADNLYMSPATTTIQINALVGNTLQAHLQNTNNPHQTTAEQIGLGNVPNYGVATNAQVTALSSSALMTPATTQFMLESMGYVPQADSGEGSGQTVTAESIGLGNVMDYGMAQNSDATAGSSNSLYMSPATTLAAINAFAVTPLDAHINNTSNPHQTTAAQVGAYSQAQVQAILQSYQPLLGFTPVQQGGAAGMGTNEIFIGWGTDADGLRCEVDTQFIGHFLFDTSSIPMSQVTNLNSTIAGLLTLTGTAANSNQLGGQVPSYYAQASQITTLQSTITAMQGQITTLQQQVAALQSSGSPSPTPTPTPNFRSSDRTGCVATSMYLREDWLAVDVKAGDTIDGITYDPLPGIIGRVVTHVEIMPQPCYLMTTVSGCQVIASDTTPMTLKDGSAAMFGPDMIHHEVLVDDFGDIRWEGVKSMKYLGILDVVLISIDDQNFFAGVNPLRRVGTHNAIQMKS